MATTDPADQTNVELVRAVFETWNDGDVADVAPFVSDEIEWLEVEGRPEYGRATEVRGKGAVQSGLEALFETWQEYRLEPETVRDASDGRVLAVVREIARGRASGLEVESRWGYLMTIRDGRLTRVEAYRDPDRALEASGLGGS